MELLIMFLAFSLVAADDPIQEFAAANNRFTQSAYGQITKLKNDSFLMSPFSAETVLAFTLSGCKGENFDELRTALHLPNDKDKIKTAVETLLPKFKSDDYVLHTANKMYVKEDFSIYDEFKNDATAVYQADIEPIVFTKNEEAAKTMNNWVEKQTNNKIKNLILPEYLSKQTRLILINALYFQANWSIPFSLTATVKRDFYKTPTETVNVDTLHHYSKDFNYYESPQLGAQFLELAFTGNDASMVIVLPNEKNGLTNLENNLDQVFATHHKLTKEYLNVALPKFKIDTEIDFKSVLESLGVEKVFTESDADLSGIAGIQGDLFMNKIIQKTFIDVAEEGVEAAAATFAQIDLVRLGFDRPSQPKNFIADHPFIFYIKVKDLIIFAGRVTDPSKS